MTVEMRACWDSTANRLDVVVALFWIAWGTDMRGAVLRIGVGLVAAVVTLVGLPAAASAGMKPEGTGWNASSIAMIATTSMEG
jgi:hypothetical protein